MNKGIKLSILLLVVAAIAAAAFFIAGKDVGENRNGGQDTSNTNAPSSVTITYDDNGFSPSEITVKAGGTVEIINESDAEVEPSSDPHPTHTTNPELNAGGIEPGGSAALTVTNKGTWGYHNHYDASETGTITVE